MKVQPAQSVRNTISAAPEKPPASLELLDRAFEIALEFGEDWRLPVALHLLALMPHSCYVPTNSHVGLELLGRRTAVKFNMT